MNNLNNNWFISLEEIQQILSISSDEFIEIQLLINKLPKQNKSITFSDFDDTICSRLPQLEFDLFAKNRWRKWDLVIDSMWLEKFLQFFYKKKYICKYILDITDIIISAWRKNVQYWKIITSWAWNKPSIIVDNHRDKPLVLLKYIIFKLWFIPTVWNFYDDRAKEIEEWLIMVWKILWIEINIFNLELNKNNICEVDSIEKLN